MRNSPTRPERAASKRKQELTFALIETIYESALGAKSWTDVMAMMKERFQSSAETFYILDFGKRHSCPVHLGGITNNWFASFAEQYFTRDNPWTVHTRALHRPGVIRTNERLAAYTRDAAILYRSQYYNEWMRPQGFKYTLGNTLRTDQGTIVNVTLLKDADLPTFQRTDVAAFTRLSCHLERALRMAARLDSEAATRDQLAAILEQSTHGLVVVDPQCRVMHCNPAACRLLDGRDGLMLTNGHLRAARADEQARLDRLLRSHLPTGNGPGAADPDRLVIRRATGTLLTIEAMPLPRRAEFLSHTHPTILLTLREAFPDTPHGQARERPNYTLTTAEQRLALRLIKGESLREIAQADDLSYETVRSYLKALFQKTGTHRQAQLVAHLMRRLPDS